MLKSERQNQICRILKENGYATVEQLSERLYISRSSIRRDLAQLEQAGLVKRRYGGAELLASYSGVLPFGTRSYTHVEEKQAIAEKAAALIREGDIVFLDQSSTCYFLARRLLHRTSLTVVTNNLEILLLLSGSGLTVRATGGTVSKDNGNCLIGGAAQRGFEEVYADIAFFSARSLSSEGVISDCTQEEIYVRNVMLRQAQKTVFLCDSSKLDSRAAYRQCTLAQVDVLITDGEAVEMFRPLFPRLEIR